MEGTEGEAKDLDVSVTNTRSPAELLAAQAAEIVTVDSSTQERKLNDEIESMLSKISEFMEVVEMIRSDTNICVNSNLPLITEKSKELQATFDRVDALELFVSHVDETLKKLEGQVAVAESHFNTFTSLKKKLFGALASIGGKHHDTSPRHQRAESMDGETQQSFQAVEIFRTEDFFPKNVPVEEKKTPA